MLSESLQAVIILLQYGDKSLDEHTTRNVNNL